MSFASGFVFGVIFVVAGLFMLGESKFEANLGGKAIAFVFALLVLLLVHAWGWL